MSRSRARWAVPTELSSPAATHQSCRVALSTRPTPRQCVTAPIRPAAGCASAATAPGTANSPRTTARTREVPAPRRNRQAATLLNARPEPATALPTWLRNATAVADPALTTRRQPRESRPRATRTAPHTGRRWHRQQRAGADPLDQHGNRRTSLSNNQPATSAHTAVPADARLCCNCALPACRMVAGQLRRSRLKAYLTPTGIRSGHCTTTPMTTQSRQLTPGHPTRQTPAPRARAPADGSTQPGSPQPVIRTDETRPRDPATSPEWSTKWENDHDPISRA